MTNLLKRTKKHWAWIPRDTLDAVIIRLHIAFERFFDIPGVGRPKYKKRGKYRSAKFQSGYLLEEGPCPHLCSKRGTKTHKNFCSTNAGSLSHQHRKWKGNVKYIQILRDNVGTYWLYVVTDDTSKEVLSATGESVGADFGMKDAFLTLNTGEKIQSPQFLKHALTELRNRSKSLSRKVKGSGNIGGVAFASAHPVVSQDLPPNAKIGSGKLATDPCVEGSTLSLPRR